MLYSSGVITDASACGSTPNHAVLVTGYNNGDTNSGLPFYQIKNSFGTTWGQDGYAMIGVQNGVGICAIQSEPVIANMLLSSNNLQTATIFTLLGLTIVVMVPLSFYFWHRQKENLHFLHPGQMILKKVMWFELAYVIVIFLVLLFGELNYRSIWDVEVADVYLMLLCNHVDFMILHYALGAQEQFSDENAHLGVWATGKFGAIFFSVLMLLACLVVWVYIAITVAPLSKWSMV